jgi:hypothetical protein
VKYICAHCALDSRFAEHPLDVLLDDGQCLKCEHCGKETVVDLNRPEFQTQLYALYTASRRNMTEGQDVKVTLPAVYKVGDLEIGVEPWRGNWSMYLKTGKETVWFRDPMPNQQMAHARAAVLAEMIRAADKRRKEGE